MSYMVLKVFYVVEHFNPDVFLHLNDVNFPKYINCVMKLLNCVRFFRPVAVQAFRVHSAFIFPHCSIFGEYAFNC